MLPDMTHRTLLLSLTLLMVAGANSRALAQAPAQAVASPAPSLADAVHIGEYVVVTDVRGRQLRGVVQSVTEAALTVGRHVLAVPDVDLVHRSDPLSNGTWAGVAAALGLTVASSARCGRYTFSEERGPCQAAAIVIGLVVGVPVAAVIGREVDRAVGDRQVYRRSSRATASLGFGWTPHGPNLAASVSW
jgi:hypothetical protein